MRGDLGERLGVHRSGLRACKGGKANPLTGPILETQIIRFTRRTDSGRVQDLENLECAVSAMGSASTNTDVCVEEAPEFRLALA